MMRSGNLAMLAVGIIGQTALPGGSTEGSQPFVGVKGQRPWAGTGRQRLCGV